LKPLPHASKRNAYDDHAYGAANVNKLYGLAIGKDHAAESLEGNPGLCQHD